MTTATHALMQADDERALCLSSAERSTLIQAVIHWAGFTRQSPGTRVSLQGSTMTDKQKHSIAEMRSILQKLL